MPTTAELAAIARRAAAALRAGTAEIGSDAEYQHLRDARPDETDAIDECETDEDAAAELDALAEGLEFEQVCAAQTEEIVRMHGASAADNANYGWGVGGEGTRISVATKVYGHGILQTEFDSATGETTHDWQD